MNNVQSGSRLLEDPFSAHVAVEQASKVESLLDPEGLTQFVSVTRALCETNLELTLPHLRLILQMEDHLDWLLRRDLPLMRDWLNPDRHSHWLRISSSIADVWQMLGGALGRLALNASVWAGSEDEEHGVLALTIAVSLHCQVNELGWRARAEQACNVPLGGLHRLYAIAEEQRIAEMPVYPYESDVDFSITPKGQYVLALLMADMADRELSSAQRLMALYWLELWSKHVMLDISLVQGTHAFEVDLGSAAGLRRIGFERGDTIRYIDSRALSSRLLELDAHVANVGQAESVPPQLEWVTPEDLADTMACLERLYGRQQAMFQPGRDRQVQKRELLARVVTGWKEIQLFLDATRWHSKTAMGVLPDQYPSTLSAHEEAGSEASAFPSIDFAGAARKERRDLNNFPLWQVRDRSQGGFGLSSPHPPDAMLPVGTLILLSVTGESHWDLCRIVRKFKPFDDSETRFGLELLGSKALPVRLTPRTPERTVLASVTTAVPTLFLNRPATTDNQDLVLLPCTAIDYTHRYELKVGSLRTPIRTTKPVHSAGAWVVMQFETDDKDSGRSDGHEAESNGPEKLLTPG